MRNWDDVEHLVKVVIKCSSVVAFLQISSFDRIKPVTLWMPVSNLRSFPFRLLLLWLLICLHCSDMTTVMNRVKMSHCLVTVSSLVHWIMLNSNFLNKDIHPHEFSWLVQITFLANTANDSLFFLHFGHDRGDRLCSF